MDVSDYGQIYGTGSIPAAAADGNVPVAAQAPATGNKRTRQLTAWAVQRVLDSGNAERLEWNAAMQRQDEENRVLRERVEHLTQIGNALQAETLLSNEPLTEEEKEYINSVVDRAYDQHEVSYEDISEMMDRLGV
jgi:hypothetical protein